MTAGPKSFFYECSVVRIGGLLQFEVYRGFPGEKAEKDVTEALQGQTVKHSSDQ